MATTQQNGTVRTTISNHPEGYRVFFSVPENGYTLDDLGALQVAVNDTRRRLADLARPFNVAFAIQHDRMAAPC